LGPVRALRANSQQIKKNPANARFCHLDSWLYIGEMPPQVVKLAGHGNRSRNSQGLANISGCAMKMVEKPGFRDSK
jgi:hypothetical protein